MISKYISKIDSERFGIIIAKINKAIDNPSILIEELKKNGVKLVVYRADFSNLVLINQLEDIGFRIKDVQLTYKYNLTADQEIPMLEPNEITYRDLQFDDTSQIVEIAKLSFNNYGHYFANDKLDRGKCLEVYMDWAKNCCENKLIADKVIVAEKHGKIAGFLAFKSFHHENYTFASLGAVNPAFRKEGIFQAINIEGLKWAKSSGYNYVETNVLNINIPVNGTYVDLGFKISKSEVTLHYWCDKCNYSEQINKQA